ncbi:MAG: hypothetical protein BMS9Abin33_0669 [Gammaproteobacteria bacterium]|nr:MAG: hypothetical protein BMS9Abin33_0669 [Gammaproteobacteria bacterium]
MLNYKWIILGLVTGVIGLSACSSEKEPEKSTGQAAAGKEETQSLDSRFSLESISRGAAVFQRNCAECHGPEAQGHPDWGSTTTGKKKAYVVAPPLNGAGVTWKRSRQDIKNIIKQGVIKENVPVMPAWKGRVDEQELDDVVTWFQALWPPEVYNRWQKAQAQTGSKRGS